MLTWNEPARAFMSGKRGSGINPTGGKYTYECFCVCVRADELLCACVWTLHSVC